MGTSQSSSTSDAFLQHCKEMYSDLTQGSSGPSFKERFVSLFGGPSTELGEKLYHLYFHVNPESLTVVDYDLFLTAMTKLRAVLSQTSKESCHFFSSLFLTSRTTLELDLKLLIHSAASCALHIGLSGDFSLDKDHPLLLAVTAAIMKYDQQHQQVSDVVVNVEHWLAMHSPRMLTGLQHWLCAIVKPIEQGPAYHLPVVQCTEKESRLQLNAVMWVLSSVLPLVYLGTLDSPLVAREDLHEGLPSGGSWNCLYSSKDHGFSMNRFQHHCFDYKQPSIMIMNCGNAQQCSFALAMDSEWRDGMYFFGGTNFHFLQLHPTYSLLKRGAKLVSLNEKQRGFPNGLRVMASQKYDYCLFEIKSSLEEARLQEGEWMQIQLVEVWGCGGMQAKETQLRMKEWETREVLRRREIHTKTSQTTWEDHPDRYLLEMGGVGTSHEQKTFD